MTRGPSTKKPSNWMAFLTNEDNKKQFITLLSKEWAKDEYARRLEGRKVTVIREGAAFLLTSEDGMSTKKTELDSLNSFQEETDKRVILYYNHAENLGYKYARIKSSDSDIFYILLYHAHRFKSLTILFDTGAGNKQRLVNISQLSNTLTPQYCNALLALHAYSGCHATCSCICKCSDKTW